MSKEKYEDFMKTPESQIQAFIAYALTEFINDVLSQSYANVDVLCDFRLLDGIKCKDDFLRKEIKAIAQSIHDSQTSLEFKVSQEIFGKDPVSRFQDILDFWLHHAFANPLYRALGYFFSLCLQIQSPFHPHMHLLLAAYRQRPDNS